MAHVHDFPVLRVSILRVGADVGRVEELRTRKRPTPTCALNVREYYLDDILVYLAGPAAEAQWRALRSGRENVLEQALLEFQETANGQPDLKSAAEIARKLSRTTYEAKHVVHFLHARVAGIFACVPVIWNAVEVLSRGLLDVHEVRGHDMRWLTNKGLRGHTYESVRRSFLKRVERDEAEPVGVGVSKQVRTLVGRL